MAQQHRRWSLNTIQSSHGRSYRQRITEQFHFELLSFEPGAPKNSKEAITHLPLAATLPRQRPKEDYALFSVAFQISLHKIEFNFVTFMKINKDLTIKLLDSSQRS